MTTFPWLSVLVAAPLVGAIVVMLLPKGADKLAKQVGLVLSVLVFALTIVMAL
ncbi:MAG: NADH-quinone oxidoreductase subunit M, partial [Actinobacteria bacterium]|nr:NADH-quinone oxidoreductase subunit M [Actinomycetota bacterium]